jgi:lipoate-protein ligase A
MPIFAELEVCNDAAPRSAAMNMAIDEALLETANIPSIRFYQWNSPALSFGYFGKFTDVADYAAERDLVRRWTGGGIVFHGDDLTYSIIIPGSAPIFAESSKSIYAAIHSALRDALNIDGQRAELAPAAEAAVTDRGYNGACFANPVRADVTVNGRKVAGAAQRRTRTRLLHQGSIHYVDLGNGLEERFAKELSEVRSEKSLSKPLVERAEKIAEKKYGTQNWLQRR